MTDFLRPDHGERMDRALLALDGLSIGDAFGQRFFYAPNVVSLIEERAMPNPPWKYTDDTEMALSIVATLQEFGGIDQDALAGKFAARYKRDPSRGYGGTAHDVLESIGNGVPWQHAAGRAFGGMGSMGNGGAMRIAPLGAYFADDMNAVVEHARMSAEVTHAHPDGQAGAIAVAAVAAFACKKGAATSGRELISFALDHTPAGDTRRVLRYAMDVPFETSPQSAGDILGNGSRVISSDTVPFALWCAARHLDNFVEAMWTTVAGLGDRDTTCAIVGGIVALAVGRHGVPPEWLESREKLQGD